MRSHLIVCASFACVTAACPSVNPTPAQIDSAVVIGDPRSTVYVVHVVGHGFVPSSVAYNLASGTGSATSDFTLQVVRGTDGRMTPSARVDAISTHELDAHLSIALEPGIYGVRLLRGGSDTPIAELEGAFEIDDGLPIGQDGGVPIEGMDALPIDQDGGVVSGTDALVDGGIDPLADGGDAGPPGVDASPDDLGVADTGEPPDLGVPDLGVPPDSGLGPFNGNFNYRQEVRLSNGSADVAPIGTTFLITIPHQSLAAAGLAKADATDFALDYGTTSLAFAWEDRTKIGTDQLVMIAQLPEVIAAGAERDRTVPLVLYYADPAATITPDDGVFTFVERFDAALGGAWTVRDWMRCNWDRSSEAMTASPGSYCVYDGTGTQRITLSSPRITAIDQTIPANQVYVLALYLSGMMGGGANDLVYFSVNTVTNAYDTTTQLLAGDWVEAAPNGTITFTETNNLPRTVSGWNLPVTRQNWTRSVARFRSPVEDPSLHMRFISIDAVNTGSFVALDDYTVRLALDVELVGTLEAGEPR